MFGNLDFAAVAPYMTDKGVLVSTVPSEATFAAVSATRESDGKRAALVIVQSRSRDLQLLYEMYRTKKLRVHLDRIFGPAQIGDAHTHVEAKHTRGKVIVTNR